MTERMYQGYMMERMISKQTVLVNGELLVSFKLSVISVMSIKAYSQFHLH